MLEPDDEENEENDLEFDDISENIINKAMESSSDTESSENMSSENASFENVSSENVSSDTVLTDAADETEEDISGASAAGDESVDYRMLMRDTKNTGKHDEDESVYTKTVRTATGKVITFQKITKCNHLFFLVWHFNTNCCFSWNWCLNTNIFCGKIKLNIISQINNLADLYALLWL